MKLTYECKDGTTRELNLRKHQMGPRQYARYLAEKADDARETARGYYEADIDNEGRVWFHV